MNKIDSFLERPELLSLEFLIASSVVFTLFKLPSLLNKYGIVSFLIGNVIGILLNFISIRLISGTCFKLDTDIYPEVV